MIRLSFSSFPTHIPGNLQSGNVYFLAVVVSVLMGLLYGFFIAIICGQRISNRHYHVLAKQELTKVCICGLIFEENVTVECP